MGVIRAMDESDVDHAMITGMGVCKKWSAWDDVEPNYYLDDESRVYPYSATDALVHHEIMTLAQEDRTRFHPFICGFDPTDRRAVDHVRRMIQLYPGFWQGIGEVFARHGVLTSMMYDEPGRANHVALAPILELAADLDMPVSIHSDVTSTSETQRAAYLGEVVDALRQHPQTRIIWCHAGMNRNLVAPTLVADLRRLLAAHENLFVDVSWVCYERSIAPTGQPEKDWLALIADFPTRFMIGSDMVGTVRDYRETMWRYDPLLDGLDAAVAQRLGRQNFLDVLPRAPVHLE